ncbi:MAG TPA: YdjY domain-containing protein, partial [Tepidisphaeraceae bacterium]
MPKFRRSTWVLVPWMALALCARGQDQAARPDASKMPHMSVDVKARQIRIEAQALNAQMPLEFFCCMTGTAEHEAVLRSEVRPSHVHLGLLMLGLQPGEPVHYSKAADKWLPPHGPPLQISCEWEGKDGKTIHVPAYRMMRNVKTKKEMPPMTWIFAGSRLMEDGKYAADTTGYLVSVVNFDLTVIDIPELASSA